MVDGQDGADTIVVGGEAFPNTGFTTDEKQLHGGGNGAEDTLVLLGAANATNVLGSNAADPGFDGTLTARSGLGSFPPTIRALWRA